jgi:hypothetical protein
MTEQDAAAMAAILRWNGIELPNEAARCAIADLAGVIAEIELVREEMGFEDEPSSFEATLAALKEQAK